MTEAVSEAVRRSESLAHGQPTTLRAGLAWTRVRDTTMFYLGLLGLFVTWLTIWTAVAIALPALLPGWSSVVITSNSMAPSIQSGDIVIAGPHDWGSVGPGTVVVFDVPGQSGLVTHRVAAVNPDGSLQTRGDANDLADSTPVQEHQVVGVGRFLFPFFGKPIVWFLRGDWALAAASVATLLGAVFVSRYAFIVPNDS